MVSAVVTRVNAEPAEFGCADSTDGGKEVEQRNSGGGYGNGENTVDIDPGRLDGRQDDA